MNLDRTVNLLKTAAPLAGMVPLIGEQLKSTIELATQICETAQGAETNREGYVKLRELVAWYTTAIASAIQKEHPPVFPGEDSDGAQSLANTGQAVSSETELKEAKGHVQQFMSVLDEVKSFLESRNEEDQKRLAKKAGRLRFRTREMWRKGDNEDKLKKLGDKVETAAKRFHVAAASHNFDTLQRIVSEMQQTRQAQMTRLDDIQRAQEELRQKREEARQADDWDRLRQELAPVHAARFDGEGAGNVCLPGTRVGLLDDLLAWAKDVSTPPVLWLSGLAGTGKTTVARSFCERLHQDVLVASFFISRNSVDRKVAKRIITSLVYQLGSQDEKIRSALVAAFRSDRDITTKPLRQIIEQLVLGALKATKQATPIVLAIDALDECDAENGREGGDMLPLLAFAVRRLSGSVKLFITSREEYSISRMFEEIRTQHGQHDAIQLHKIEHFIVRSDIRKYLEARFREISCQYEHLVNLSWPPEDDLVELLRRAGVLFVYAVAVYRFLDDKNYNPEKRLKELLDQPGGSSIQSGPYDEVDNLYLDMMKRAGMNASGKDDEKLCCRIRTISGAIVLLQDPLKPDALASLLERDPIEVGIDLRKLSAVLILEKPSDPIKIFHPSFSDFVRIRCSEKRFLVDEETHHGYLAIQCLKTMNRHLKQNICNIQDASLLNSELSDLPARLDKHAPMELRYACRHWMTHLGLTSQVTETIFEELKDFCSKHILHWIEILSLVGILADGLSALPTALKWCEGHPEACQTAIFLLTDAERTMREFYIPIKASAMQVYETALTFMPECSLHTLACKTSTTTSKLISERRAGWGQVLRVIEGHTNWVNSVAFSPDGKQIASGSNDKTVRIWDTVTGENIATLQGHNHWVFSVTFSPDGRHIVSGSEDKTVQVWDAITGENIATLEGHSDWVNSVTLSPDGKQIVSGSDDNTVRVWDKATGKTLATLNGHEDSVTCVTFSSDGSLIASGSEDRTVWIWDTFTGESIAELRGHNDKVLSVVFSPDGKRIASGSTDKTMRIWDMTTHNYIAKFDLLSGVNSVIFSPDGKYIAAALARGHVRILDAASGENVATLKSHTDYVRSVAFSPDGKRIASGSDDKTVRVWDTAAVESITPLQGHTSNVYDIAISPDGKRMISGSKDQTVRIWDMVTGENVATLEGHTDTVNRVAFSPDGNCIASSSDDWTVRLWHTITGENVATLKGHRNWVYPIVFSPDGKHIASGSYDKTVRVWDTSTGESIAILNGHEHTVWVIAFSKDGKRIASCSSDKPVRVWDVVTGESVAILEGHSSRIVSVSFGPDGKHIFSRDSSGKPLAWNAGEHFPSFADRPIEDTPEDMPSFPEFSLDNNSGWLFIKQSEEHEPKRLYWISVDRRVDATVRSFDHTVVLGARTGIITILRVSPSSLAA